jgi:hypothetical protein
MGGPALVNAAPEYFRVRLDRDLPLEYSALSRRKEN